jgi:hypothetical protein
MSETRKPAALAAARSKAPLTPNWIELQRVIPLGEASRLSSLSIDTIKREHPEKVIRLSPRRCGMRLGDALNLSV